MKTLVINRRLGLCLLTIGAAMMAGCSMDNPIMAPMEANGKPLVWSCSMVQMSSPPKYACPDGKTYTAFQLRDFRLGPDKTIASK
jgi:hypothetical protein